MRRVDREGIGGDALALMVPLLLPIEFNVGGRLFLPEVVLLVALPFLFHDARKRGVSRISRTVVALGLVWLVGLVVTDLYRGTAFVDYSRGWSRVGFLLLNFAALSLLIDDRWRRVFLVAWGLAAGTILQFLLNPNALAGYFPWKFGYGFGLTLAGVLLAANGRVYRRPPIAIAILVFVGALNVWMDFRSLGGVCLLAAALAALAAYSSRLIRLGRPPIRTALIVTTLAVCGVAVVGAYSVAAGRGLLGAQAEYRYEHQAGILGIPVGRPETIASVRAIRDSPLLGHGSWPKDPKYLSYLVKVLRDHGIEPSNDLLALKTIPTHSHFLGTWVEAGVLGTIFWIWCLVLDASLLPRLYLLMDGRIVFVAFAGVAFLWDILLSPFSAERRLFVAFYVIVLLLARPNTSPTAESRQALLPADASR